MMRQKIIRYLLPICILITTFCSMNAAQSVYSRYNTPSLSQEDEEAKRVLLDAHQKEQGYNLKLRKQFVSNSQDDEAYEREYREFRAQLALNLSRFNYEHLKSTKRQVQRLSKLQLNGLPTNQYEEATRLLKNMELLSIKDNVNSREYTGKLSLQETILRKIQTTTDPDEILFFWTEWRNAISADAKKYLREYRKYYRRAATLNGDITPSKTWYLYYEDDNFLSKLEQVMHDLMPLYKELHAYLRHSIKEKYGEKVPYHGPIPHHFMEQIMEQDWYSKSAFTVPYPHNTLPDVNGILSTKLSNSTSLLNAAIWFYEQGLQLPPFPPQFLRNYAIPLTEQEASIDCRSIPKKFLPDYGIKYCPKLGFKKFLQMHQAVAKVMYYKESRNLQIGLNDEACPGFADAIGEAAVIAAGSPRHLEKMQVVINYTTNTELKMNRLFRMAVHTLISTFQYFINEKFWVEYLDQKITDDNMNCEYWKLQLEWAGVAPPIERNEETFDAGYKFYSGISDEKSFTRKLISEILGYQFYKAFCKQNSQYLPDDPINTLNTCDIFGSPEVGKKMGEMMSKGSLYHWHDVMEILTHTRGLDASAMIEYYAPLFNWLRAYNRENHIRTGWESTNLCES